jgi:hypothetical protein
MTTRTESLTPRGRRTRHLAALPAAAALVLLVACNGDSQSPFPTGPSVPPPPNVSGSYEGYQFWTLQAFRVSDGFTKSFVCQGSMTLTQSIASGGVAQLSGFAVVGYPCDPLSFDVVGTVSSGGTIVLVTDGPPPTEGPCPGGTAVSFSGLIRDRELSARGETTVECPSFGEHQFTYILQGWR